ncbi:MAG TPA: hypothetical protein VNA29_09455 [Sphingomicrobium sp.]|nr:hypothetical protein [Sphingomicrobium sp.]
MPPFFVGGATRSAIDQSWLGRAARRLAGEPALARAARLDERRGCERIELELRKDPRLPATFRANPAQHCYALQHAATQRRRQHWSDDCDREADAVALAA